MLPKVCRHHASRGLAVLLRHGIGGKNGDPCPPPPPASAAAMVRRINTGGDSVLNIGRRRSKQNAVSTNDQGGTGSGGGSGSAPRVTFGDEQRQPWRVVQTWLNLRHDLAVVALSQVRAV